MGIERGERAVVDMKKKYNQSLAKYRKAYTYLDNNSIPLDEREKHLQKFRDLMYELNDIILQIRAAGYNMTSEEIRGGFTP